MLQIKTNATDEPTVRRYKLDAQYKSVQHVQQLVEGALGSEMYVLLEDAESWTTLALPLGCTVSIVDERLLNGET